MINSQDMVQIIVY